MNNPSPTWLLAEHQRRNRTTLNATGRFEPHRQRVMQLVMQAAAAPRSRLCILGAGNCNDLELSELLAPYQELHLVDLDSAATELAVARKVSEPLRSRVHVAASTDVTGIYGLLRGELQDTNDQVDIRHLLSQLAARPPQIPEAPFNCVVSSCLLSQLVDSVSLALGANHPSLVEVILALRKQHLRTLVQAIVPGGHGLLFFDFLSSQTFPNLMQIEPNQLNQQLLEAIAGKNFFTGLNPFAVQFELQSNLEFVGKIAGIRLHHPWRWDIGEKQFAVSAISFTKS